MELKNPGQLQRVSTISGQNLKLMYPQETYLKETNQLKIKNY